MRMAVKSFVAIWLILGLLGCGGKDFVRPSPEDFKLGETTYAQVIQQMGEPRRAGDTLKNGKTVKTVTYVYASKGGEPLEADVIPARALTYYFYNDALVGQDFTSSFKSDNSNFDEKRVESIKKGQTTRAEVIKLLGEPTATFIPPMVKETSGEAIGYTYQAVRGGLFSGLKNFVKVLRISFDDKGLVLDIEYASSDNK
jgi:outer membrane protein assembly factor BamE (lipoprotein component of BamABCDE complex)